jgi:2-polyprenyl-3-methyl-5-hydroxy-6-metoxy-1,4-benzoquinol methylase
MRDRFLPQHDPLAELINGQAATLYDKLFSLPVEKLGLPDHCLLYFRSSHFNRLFFSIETSARLLYNAITLREKPVTEITIMDYGAGVGTLYMLAKMIGCKKVIYNDFLEEWRISALKIAEAVNISIDEYMLGDIDDTLRTLEQKNIRCDIITSRNVIEHVYNLEHFFKSIQYHQPQALIYSSTTANFYNPAAHIKHVLWHKKWEKEYFRQRMDIIKRTGLTQAGEVYKLAKKTKGLATDDLLKAVREYKTSRTLPDPAEHYSNTCEPNTGVWAEHLLRFEQYRKAIGTENYSIGFLPGFWDTHYSRPWKNIFASVMNSMIRMGGGVPFAPFIYVIAKPKEATGKRLNIREADRFAGNEFT